MNEHDHIPGTITFRLMLAVGIGYIAFAALCLI